jgi:hypothetical protein
MYQGAMRLNGLTKLTVQRTQAIFKINLSNIKGTLQSFFSRKATLSGGLHRDLLGCILHAVPMSTRTSAHRKMHACRDVHVK